MKGTAARRVGAPELLLLIVLTVALFLRFQGISSGLPELVHPDENLHVTHRLVPMAEGDRTLHVLKNPYGFSNLLYLESRLAHFSLSLIGRGGDGFKSTIANTWKAGGRELFLLARVTSAVLGTATVWILYLAGRELFRCHRTSLMAAALLAVNFLHVRDSHFGTNDVTATFLLTAAFWQITRARNSPAMTSFLWTGVFSGLAVGVKYNAALIVAPLLLAVLLQVGERGEKRVRGAVVGLTMVVAVAGIAFIVANPQIVSGFNEYRTGLRSLRHQATAGPHLGQDQLPAWLLFLRWMPPSIGWLQALCFPVAALMLARTQPRRFLMVISLPLALFARRRRRLPGRLWPQHPKRQSIPNRRRRLSARRPQVQS